VRATRCPYARLADYETVTLRSPRGFWRAAARLRLFSLRNEAHGSTAMLAIVSAHVYGGTLDGLASLLHCLLLCANTGSCNRLSLYTGIDTTSWRLPINGAHFFTIVVSEHYTSSHPRYVRSGAVFLMQPELLFSSVGISSGAGRQRQTAAAQRSFLEGGTRYFAHHTIGTPKALRFILDEQGAGIRWWETDPWFWLPGSLQTRKSSF